MTILYLLVYASHDLVSAMCHYSMKFNMCSAGMMTPGKGREHPGPLKEQLIRRTTSPTLWIFWDSVLSCSFNVKLLSCLGSSAPLTPRPNSLGPAQLAWPGPTRSAQLARPNSLQLYWPSQTCSIKVSLLTKLPPVITEPSLPPSLWPPLCSHMHSWNHCTDHSFWPPHLGLISLEGE
jgi:hypothetical protein